MIDNIFNGFSVAFGFHPLLFCFIGTAAGVFVGGIPGLSGAMLIALFLPVTFYMDPSNALALIVGIYVGAVAGGLIAATLLRIPGTISAIMTTFDGYPMAKSGRPGHALGLGISASLFGGVAAWLVLTSVAEPLSTWATQFSPFDYFALIMVAFVLITSLSEEAMSKGLLSAGLGFLLALPGIDPSSGEPRITFDLVALNAGFPMLPFFVGMFAFGTVLSDILSSSQSRADAIAPSRQGALLKLKRWRAHFPNLTRSSAIGVGVGILPGIGSNVSSVIAYMAAKKSSKTPEAFGSGSEEGIVAAEASNNAAVGGALVPTLALGIPGSFIDILLLAAFLIHELQPGPLLFTNHPELAYGVIASYFIANLFMFALMTVSIGGVAKLASFPRAHLYPLIIVFSIVGAYAMSNTSWALVVMLIFGFLGFALERLHFPLAPFAVAYVLGPLAEQKLRTGLQITGGDYLPLLTSPVSGGLLLVAVAFLLLPVVSAWRNRTRMRSTTNDD